MIYEYRRYTAMPGRLGDLNARFRDLTLKIWERHGIKTVGFWTADIGESNVLHYIIQWQDLAEREQKWKAFGADPAWAEGRAKSEEHGPLVEHIENELWSPMPYAQAAVKGLV
ncbi:MAG TPA: NIPSNAP family protein [Chloroflexota bacterium]|nr:NIPSNAP family protein [Chloroflexota bacterium]